MPHEIPRPYEIAEAGDGKRRQQSSKRTQRFDHGIMGYHGASGSAEHALLSSPFGRTAHDHDFSLHDYDKTSIGYRNEEQEQTNSGNEDRYNKDFYYPYLQQAGITTAAEAQSFLRHPNNAQAIEQAPALREALEEIIDQDYKNRLDGLDRNIFLYSTRDINPKRSASAEVRNDSERLQPHIQAIKEYMKNPVPFYRTKAITALKFIYQHFHTFQITTQERLRGAGIPHLDQAGPSET